MKKAFISLALVAVLVQLADALRTQHSDGLKSLPPSDSIMGIYNQAAVTTNGYLCAGIGSDILQKGGNAVEAAIAALFCEGVIFLQSMGIGGGFLMTIYSRENQTAVTLNARETAPASSYTDMFHGNSTLSQYGGMAAAVPGELKGYWEAFNTYKSGNVTWSDLVYPSVKICQEGFEVNSNLAELLKSNEDNIKKSETLSELLINPETGSVWQLGDILKRPTLGETLIQIAENGIDIFYNGSLGEKFIKDVTDLGGIMTMDDLRNYEIHWEPPVSAKLSGNVTLYTMPLPGSGPVLAFILNILDGYIPASDEITTYQRITEAFKYGYGRRTELGDPYFNEDVLEIVKNLTSRSYAESIRAQISDSVTYNDPGHYGAVLSQPDDHGTAHISVIAPNGDAVSVTSTINLFFGAMVVSKSTGIILNDEMDDFSAPNITSAAGIPPSPANFIQPGKRPLSSMSPSIFVNGSGDVQLVTGAAGGPKIISATTLVSIYSLWFNKTIKEAIDHSRIHHQLFPMTLLYEEGFEENVIEGLSKIGHSVQEFPLGGTSVNGIGVSSRVTGIAVSGGKIYANSDFRVNGVVAGF
ncbi:scoloptoxin SSD14-like isoform X1 [Schistocerca serialis cubense]|uniref:scoloptoxin SSD14-like isoform X1 n=1 Tax=Schistocerca serialis cubense TaxID=2023355 RepID=UPI00214E2204|nr:scoloptoxin SSD14-like isoform X1 [Schistocerca serialis cubense]XP_049942000.1 scoloptoxin SSD14-like isoform X1 [Schistocerca serialis cubense]